MTENRMVKFFNRLFAFSIILALSGCICDCFDEMDNAIHVTLCSDADPLCFSPEEIDTIFVYQVERGTGVVVDSAVIHENQFTLSEPISLFTREPFWDYDYRVRPQSAVEFMLTDIQIAGEHNGSIPCRCYENTKKRITANGVVFDFSGKGSSWYDNNVILKKY